jgi:septal ring factor EnvC (AmiA/AmiB activator)
MMGPQQQLEHHRSPGESSQKRGHWPWLGACALSLALGCLLVSQWHRRLSLRPEFEAHSAAVRDQGQRNAQLSADLAAFDDLLDRHTRQREQLVAEIAEFQKQLELLSRRTQRLEFVRDQLQLLDSEFSGFRQTEDRFKANLRQLEQSVASGAGQQGQR